MSSSFDAINNEATFSLPIVVGKARAPTKQVRNSIQEVLDHVAVLQFQMLIQEMDRSWPEEVDAIKVSVRNNPDLGRLLVIFQNTQDGLKVDAEVQNTYRERIESVSDTILPQCDDFVTEAFGAGSFWITRSDLAELMMQGLAQQPHTVARLKAARMGKQKAPAVAKPKPRF